MKGKSSSLSGWYSYKIIIFNDLELFFLKDNFLCHIIPRANNAEATGLLRIGRVNQKRL